MRQAGEETSDRVESTGRMAGNSRELTFSLAVRSRTTCSSKLSAIASHGPSSYQRLCRWLLIKINGDMPIALTYTFLSVRIDQANVQFPPEANALPPQCRTGLWHDYVDRFTHGCGDSPIILFT